MRRACDFRKFQFHALRQRWPARLVTPVEPPRRWHSHSHEEGGGGVGMQQVNGVFT